MKLTLFVGLYLLCTVAIGLFAATRVRSTTDYALAGRSLPLVMVITATFATWFGSETVLGLPGQFIKNGLEGVVEEPFGSSMALILVGMFFARKLYRMSLLTIGDFYRRRYGVSVELCCSIFVVLSYLGWVAAQVAALGLVIHLLTEGYVSVSNAMIVGTIGTAEENFEADKNLQDSIKEVKKYPDCIAAMMDMEAGRVDAIITDEIVGRYYMRTTS